MGAGLAGGDYVLNAIRTAAARHRRPLQLCSTSSSPRTRKHLVVHGHDWGIWLHGCHAFNTIVPPPQAASTNGLPPDAAMAACYGASMELFMPKLPLLRGHCGFGVPTGCPFLKAPSAMNIYWASAPHGQRGPEADSY